MIEEIHRPTNTLGCYRRSAHTAQRIKRVYLSTGIHGDEPAGPLAMRKLLQDDSWPSAMDLWVCPCLNPAGFTLNRRENADGIDLNRDYLDSKAPETLAHIAWLKRQPPFDLSLCLHEDWESHGFYLYEQNPDNQPSLAESIMAGVAQVCPIDLSEATIEGWPSPTAPYARTWTRAREMGRGLLSHHEQNAPLLHTRGSLRFPITTRVGALTAAVNAALRGSGAARRTRQASRPHRMANDECHDKGMMCVEPLKS